MTETMLKVALVVGCLLGLTEAQPMSVTLSDSVIFSDCGINININIVQQNTP